MKKSIVKVKAAAGQCLMQGMGKMGSYINVTTEKG